MLVRTERLRTPFPGNYVISIPETPQERRLQCTSVEITFESPSQSTPRRCHLPDRDENDIFSIRRKLRERSLGGTYSTVVISIGYQLLLCRYRKSDVF